MKSLAERFWSKAKKSDGCWEWTGRKTKHGYGRLTVGGREVLAHRVAWTLTRGAIPLGKVALHTCDNPSCVRPDHLRLGTQADNVRDMYQKRRNNNLRGERHPASKLTEDQVLTIRMRCANGEGRRKLAREYHVSHTNIRHILKGSSWKWLVAGRKE